MFRKINASDRSEFLAMSREFYSSPAVLSNIPEKYHENTFSELMRSDVYLEAYIFEVDSAVAGYALLNKTFNHEVGGTVIWIEELYVRSDFQGKGIGGNFLEWLVSNYPVARFRLETEPENERAAALYEKKGFSVLPYVQMIKDM